VAFADEYEERFRSDAAAWAYWEKQAPSYRRTVTHWVMSAKKEETRQRRLATLIADSRAGVWIAAMLPDARRRPQSTSDE
jgi:uncharacterized protein YdeI (YjbR/CyaY-like superfamily)